VAHAEREIVELLPDITDRLPGDICFIGEIDGCFHSSQYANEIVAPSLDYQRCAPQRMMEGELALPLGLGLDEIAQAFRHHQIDALMPEGASGEFAGFRRSEARNAPERCQERTDDGQAAMDMELGHILTGKAPRSGEQEKESIIEDLSRSRVAEGPPRGSTWLR
jgi:hypothetical protein